MNVLFLFWICYFPIIFCCIFFNIQNLFYFILFCVATSKMCSKVFTFWNNYFHYLIWELNCGKEVLLFCDWSSIFFCDLVTRTRTGKILENWHFYFQGIYNQSFEIINLPSFLWPDLGLGWSWHNWKDNFTDFKG